ncbi:MAG: hypothetical protein EOP60_17705 [Sphingomonadales bacterium]|nr:MAG: hypothetical protein EOP60_17705 [Sphingomonadales bacterium]
MLVITCGGYAKFLANDPQGCESIRKTYAAFDLSHIHSGPFGKRVLVYHERSAKVIEGCTPS